MLADWLASTGGGTDAGLSRIPGGVNGRDVQDLMWWMSFASEKSSGHSLCGKECQTAIGDRGHQQRRVKQGVALDSTICSEVLINGKHILLVARV